MQLDNNLISALLAAIIALAGGLVSLSITNKNIRNNREQLNKELEAKLIQSYDALSLALIQQRFAPYVEFFRKLEPFSSTAWKDIYTGPEFAQERKARALACADLFHNALYDTVGTFASHETRELMVLARTNCKILAETDFEIGDLLRPVWAVHDSLRADLGINQPWLPRDFDRRTDRFFEDREAVITFVERLETSHWDYNDLLPLSRKTIETTGRSPRTT